MKHQLYRLCYVAIILLVLAGCKESDKSPTATALPTATTAAPQSESLLIRVTQFPPQYYLDESGNWTGLDVELARALLEKAGFTPEFVERPWSRALQEMETGELDVMMNLSQTPERSAYMAWVGPERQARMVLVVKQENVNLPIETIDDLAPVAQKNNMRYGIQQDAFYSQEFNDRLEADAEFALWFETVTEAQLNPRKTASGRILGFFEDYDSVRYKLANDPEYAGLALHSFIISESPVYFGVSMAGVSPEALERLQAAYTQLEQDGAFDAIRNAEWK